MEVEPAAKVTRANFCKVTVTQTWAGLLLSVITEPWAVCPNVSKVLLLLLLCAQVCVCIHVCDGAHVEVRRYLAKSWCSPSATWIQGANSFWLGLVTCLYPLGHLAAPGT